jgi:hypothetical protein
MSLSETFDRDGFLSLPEFLTNDACDAIVRELDRLTLDGAGTREVLSHEWCRELAGDVLRGCEERGVLPAGYAAVQCTYFRKSRERNWFVAWHQDLAIPVSERVESAVLTGWSDKEGGLFVQPPAAVLEELVAMRLHLDECAESNGPLRVVPGSHRLGRLTPEEIVRCRDEAGEVVCTLPRGGALAMRPLILHASAKATGAGDRRVLHFLFGPPTLPHGLRWRLAV